MSGHNTPNVDDFAQLLAYAPIFDQAGFRPAKEHRGKELLAHPDYEESVKAFFRGVAKPCWLDPSYDISALSRRVHDPAAIANADLALIRSMLTFCLGGERFSDGHWVAMFDAGVVQRLLRCLKELQSVMAPRGGAGRTVGDNLGPPLKTCLRPPIPEIFEAARVLSDATDAHLRGERRLAAELLVQANMPAVREWTESLWGKGGAYAVRRSGSLVAPSKLPARTGDRMPGESVLRQLHQRDGFHCRFCGIPVIRKAVRQRFVRAYPELMLWGRTNPSQHAAFQCMWAQPDHVVPHSHGGTNDLDNIIVTCAPCNYGRMGFTLEEAGLEDPRLRGPTASTWGIARSEEAVHALGVPLAACHRSCDMSCIRLDCHRLRAPVSSRIADEARGNDVFRFV